MGREMSQDYFTDAEICEIRANMQTAIAGAAAEHRKRGHKVNPRLAAARSNPPKEGENG